MKEGERGGEKERGERKKEKKKGKRKEILGRGDAVIKRGLAAKGAGVSHPA